MNLTIFLTFTVPEVVPIIDAYNPAPPPVRC